MLELRPSIWLNLRVWSREIGIDSKINIWNWQILENNYVCVFVWKWFDVIAGLWRTPINKQKFTENDWKENQIISSILRHLSKCLKCAVLMKLKRRKACWQVNVCSSAWARHFVWFLHNVLCLLIDIVCISYIPPNLRCFTFRCLSLNQSLDEH